MVRNILVFVLTAFALMSPAFASDYEMTLSADKSYYDVGDVVEVRGKVTDDSGDPIAKAVVTLEIDTPETIFYVGQLTTNSLGKYEAVFKLPDDAIQGKYKVYAVFDEISKKDTFIVGEEETTEDESSSSDAGSVTSSSVCYEGWVCGDWSDCSAGVQTRECYDANSCGTYNLMPSESRSCTMNCSEQGGFVCSSDEVCSGSWLEATDSGRCCSVECSDAAPTEESGLQEEDDSSTDSESEVSGSTTPTGFAMVATAISRVATFALVLLLIAFILVALKKKTGSENKHAHAAPATEPRVKKLKVMVE